MRSIRAKNMTIIIDEFLKQKKLCNISKNNLLKEFKYKIDQKTYDEEEYDDYAHPPNLKFCEMHQVISG